MTTALPRLIFDKTAQLCLDDLELLMEVSQRLEDVGQRLACFELVLVDADAIDDPIVAIHDRLDGLSARLSALDSKQRRPVAVQLYVNDDPPAEKRPAVDLRATMDARDRMTKLAAQVASLTARFAGMTRRLDTLCGASLPQKVARVTNIIEDLIDNRVENRGLFSALNDRMATLEMKMLAAGEKQTKFDSRLDKCATAFNQMRDRLAAIEAKLAITEVVKDA